jgi:diguanylate cyclase (GGDEF)-like protein
MAYSIMYKIRHTFLAFSISLFIGYVSFEVAKHYNEHIQFTKAEVVGTELLPSTKKLLIDTHTLRCSLHYFYNQKRLCQEVKKSEESIQKDILQLSILFQKIDFPASKKQLHFIEKTFTKLQNYKQHKPEVIFATMDTLISDNLELITTISNDSNLILDPKLQTYYFMDTLINTLPQMIVDLAKIKKFYFLQTNQQIDTSNTNLAEIYGMLQNSKTNLFTSLNYILHFNPDLQASLAPQFTHLKKQLTTMLDVIKEQNVTPKIFLENYFSSHNDLMHEIATLYDMNNKILAKLLEERLDRYIMQRDAIIFSAFIFFVIVLLLLSTLFKKEQVAQHNKYLAYHDQLTSLYNKYALDKTLQTKNPTGALLVDIKKFSSINDLYGEMVGDIVLQKFTLLLQHVNKKFQCDIFRVASDQFMFLSYDEDHDICHQVAKALFKNINNTPIETPNGLSISLKVRIAKVLINTAEKDDKLYCKIQADIALNYAKKKYKDYITYDKDLELEKRLQKELEVVEMVRDAILENRVVPVFQRIKKKTQDSFESLIRIKSREDGTLIPPAYFLETVQNTPYYPQLTKIMINKSFSYFSKREESFSINFSFQDITNKTTVTYLIKMVEKYSMHNRLIIELLETESMQNIHVVKHFITKMRSYGIKIAIDDFGSGYSNFIYIAQLEPDFIKIDGSIIKNINNDEKSFIIAKHIHNFAKEIGCQTIAEYVHSQEVNSFVEKLNIDGRQGYFIQKPLEKV